MCRFLCAILTLSLLVGLAGGGELRPVELDDEHNSMAHHVWRAGDFSDANGLPGVVNSRAVRIRCPLRGSPLTAWIVIDTRKPSDRKPNIARIVFGGKGDDFREALTSPVSMERHGSNRVTTIQPVMAKVKVRGTTIPVQVGGRYSNFGRRRMLELLAATASEAECDFGGRTARVRLMDRTGNLQVTDAFRPDRNAYQGYQRGDSCEVRFKNADGKLTVVKGPLGCPVKVDGAWWTLELSEDGKSISAKPFDVPMGKVKLPDWQVRGYMVSEELVIPISSPSGGEKAFQVPAGTYVLRGIDMSRRRRNENGSQTFYDHINIDDRAGNAPVTVKAEKTTDLNVGEPLIAGLDVRSLKGGFTGRRIRLNLNLTDCAGRQVRWLNVSNRRPDAPTFQVTGEDGKMVYSNSLEYG
ncbi:MAG: hypothetical protein ACLFV7_03440 [Phycisphaerae bacterium]